jgi:hypothetical protein
VHESTSCANSTRESNLASDKAEHLDIDQSASSRLPGVGFSDLLLITAGAEWLWRNGWAVFASSTVSSPTDGTPIRAPARCTW